VVVSLLNGVDHVETLRRRYRNVVGAAIRVESERVTPGLIRQTSPFLRVDMAGADEVQEALRDAGIDCRRRNDEATLLWEKLVFLAPIALATSAFDAPLGAVRSDPAFLGCRDEAFSASLAAGTNVEIDAIRSLHEAAPVGMQSSMQKDVAKGRPPEIVAIAGPITRLGNERGFPTSSTDALVNRIRTRLRKTS
jgi:2-dehydropantoate 2-reductase